jgi:type I restriction enzyme R subunit
MAQEIDARGTIDVLRNGVKGNGCKFFLCTFRPAHGLTPLLTERYEANRLTVTRQQRYAAAHNNTLDIVLWVNGLAVVTVELKNPLTGQDVEDAKAQYRSSARDPKDPFLAKRAVVHFAVDPHLAFMTTRLAGADTRFLPFNQGHDNHQGNPPASGGKHATAYLWNDVWQRDAFLDLVGRFIHVEVDEAGKQTGAVIFPRYHQWDGVRRLEAHARANGAGHRYLVQHSAGSGKSNSIAWLAHRLSQLHDDHDKAVFDKVVVITDRRVLDEQLSGTVKQFESTAGVVRRIDGGGGSKNKDLADALTTETARIILCTLQTFSHVDASLAVGRRNYAVIVDEAHSSQTGEAAKDLKGVLGAATEEERLAMAEKAEAGEAITGEDLIAEAVAARATQPNLSFFAFTATPKPRTVELFGTMNPATGRKQAFHVYSMRQAIEEGFILDVLRQYTTFDIYWKVRQHVAGGDPEVPKAKAAAQIATAVSLHEHNLAQRAKVIVDHFRANVRPALDGTAKAMVVTASRLHAVRYKQAIDRYLADHHLTDTRAVVAFSGKVTDPDDPHGDAWTETSMNGFPESETAKRFKGEDGFPVDGYQVLVVAEKFQTGFDAPRLLAMYVDKKLEGVNAVQTLARLNRSFPGKPQPFVLDFRNDAEAITDAFRPWFDTTVVEPVDPNLLYTLQGTLHAAGVFDHTDVDHYWEVFAPVASNDRKGNGALYAALAGPRQRFISDLDDDEKATFRSDLDSYARAYAFLAQIVEWTDADLEKLYIFARSLLADLPAPPGGGGLDLGADVELTHLRIEARGTLDASIGDNEVDPLNPFPGGGGPAGDPEVERLSAIVDRLNEKHGYQLTITDALLFEQFRGDWAADDDLAAAAKANTFENFMIPFAKKFMEVVLGRMDANAEIFQAILDDPGFADDLKSSYGRDLYSQLNDD